MASFLKREQLILGLNADIRFIPEFIDETKVGVEDSRGKGSPRVDMLGISNYTTLVELKELILLFSNLLVVAEAEQTLGNSHQTLFLVLVSAWDKSVRLTNVMLKRK